LAGDLAWGVAKDIAGPAIENGSQRNQARHGEVDCPGFKLGNGTGREPSHLGQYFLRQAFSLAPGTQEIRQTLIHLCH